MSIAKMTPKEYDQALEALELTNYSLAKLLGVEGRTGRAWHNGEYRIQPPLAAFLRLAARLNIKPARLAKLINDRLD